MFHLAEGGACNAASYCAPTHMSYGPLTGLGADEHGGPSPRAQPHSRPRHQQTSREGHLQHRPRASHHQQHAPGEARNYSQSSRKLPGAGEQMLCVLHRLQASGWLRVGRQLHFYPVWLGCNACGQLANCMCRAGPPVRQEKGAWLGPQPGCACQQSPSVNLCCCSGTFFFAATHFNSTGGPEGDLHYRKEKQARFGAGRVSTLHSQAGFVCWSEASFAGHELAWLHVNLRAWPCIRVVACVEHAQPAWLCLAACCFLLWSAYQSLHCA